MASNTKKRDVVKYVRDGIKSNYKKQDNCAICYSQHDLELHHYHSVKIVVDEFITANNLPEPVTEDDCVAIREALYKERWFELVDDTVTLCVEHHRELHKIYGVIPLLNTVDAQRNWVLKRNAKFGEVRGNAVVVSAGRFSRFKC